MYSQVKNPQWANAEQTLITCEVLFDHIPNEFLPFTAVASGDYDYTHEIFARCVAGEFGTIAAYVAPQQPAQSSQPTVNGAQTL